MHGCLALCNWTNLAGLMLAGMACSMQLCNCMYCTCIDKPTNALLGVDSAGIRVIKPANKDELVQGIQQFWATQVH